MTRKEARKAAEVMLAYADGKDVEFCINGEDWDLLNGDDSDQLGFDFSKIKYRIKKEPTYRPFKDKEECWNEMQKHHPFGWVKVINENAYYSILTVNNGELYEEPFEKLTFADGTPFGIKEE